MRWTTTIALIVTALLAAVVAARLHDAAPRRLGNADAPLLDARILASERIRAIRIHQPPQATIVIEQRDGTWLETRPFEMPVSPFEVRETVIAARELVSTRRLDAARLVADGTTLHSLALQPPLATVTFVTVDDREIVVHLGRLGVAGRAFAQVGDGQDVHVVGRELHDRVLGDRVRGWRERTLFPDASLEASAIRTRAGDATMAAERTGSAWRLVEPTTTRADASAVTALLTALARAESDGFVAEHPDDLRPFGLHAPAASITVVARPGGRNAPRERTLLIGGPVVAGGADRFAMIEGRPLVMRVSGATLSTLFASPAALVEPTAAEGRPEDVRVVTVELATRRERLARTPLGWRLEHDAVRPSDMSDDPDASEPPASSILGPADARRVDELLVTLLEARAGAILIRAYPEALHHATVTLEGFDDAAPTVVRIAIDEFAGQWAAESGDGVMRIHPMSNLPLLLRGE